MDDLGSVRNRDASSIVATDFRYYPQSASIFQKGGSRECSLFLPRREPELRSQAAQLTLAARGEPIRPPLRVYNGQFHSPSSSVPPRDLQPELMDDPALPADEHRRALRGLARLNALSGSVAVLWPEVRKLARGLGRPLRILDVATGAGDVPVGLAKRALGAGISLDLSACDISPVALDATRERFAAVGTPIHLFIADALAEPLPTGFDIVICSLFLHHLSEGDAVMLLGRLAAATEHLVLVNDLSRSRWNLGLVWCATRMVTRSRIVHVDGPRSVRAAFTAGEARALAERAGLNGATVAGRFPCRWLLTWRKPA